MKSMKHKIPHQIVGALFLLLSLGSCSSDGPGEQGPGQGEYFFKFKVEGEAISYPFTPATQINLTGILDHDPNTGLHVANIAGIKDNTVADLADRLTFFLGDPNEFATAQPYSNVAGADRILPATFQMAYADAQGDIYVASINTTAPPLYAPAQLQFTEIAQDHISGTFSGTLNRYDISGGKLELVGSLAISEGSFKVPRH